MQIKLGYHKYMHIELYCTFFWGYALWLFLTHISFLFPFFLFLTTRVEKKTSSYACDCTHAHNIGVNKPWRKDICCFLNFKTTRQTFNFCSIRRSVLCFMLNRKKLNPVTLKFFYIFDVMSSCHAYTGRFCYGILWSV